MEFERYNPANPRLKTFYLVFAILIPVLVSGLAYQQLIKGPQYLKQEKQQNFRRILIPGPRGDIYDREGRLLVGNRPLFSAVVYLNELRPEFREEYFRLVSQARDKKIDIDRRKLQTAARRNVVQRYVNQVNAIIRDKRVVDLDDIDRHFRQNLLLPLVLIRDLEEVDYARLIEQLDIDSPVQIITDSARYYPYRSAAAHTLGFVVSTEEIEAENAPGEDLTTFRFKGKVGRTGIERYFNDHLQGKSGSEIWVVDPSGFQYERTDFKRPVKGENLTTSLDIDLQLAAENAMGEKIGAVAALNVQTGEVLALASKPHYDLNRLSPFIPFSVDREIREKEGWLNRAIQGLYPPGSTFKLVTAIAGLRSGEVNTERVIECRGYFRVGRRNFPCHNRAGHGLETLEESIRDSCNVYYYDIGTAMGIDIISAQAREFGLDQPTGIELHEETGRMLVPDPAWKKERFYDRWYDGDTANVSIGQGYLLVTPLQMATFTASLARAETRTRPTLRRQNDSAEINHGSTPIPLNPRQYARIIEGMEMATQSGTARNCRIPGIRIGAKTGTAQVRKDGQNLTLAWTVAFAPVDDPQIAIAVMIEGTVPGDSYHGGSTAAPIAKAVFDKYFEKNPHNSHLAATTVP